jgi:hypothetical protein
MKLELLHNSSLQALASLNIAFSHPEYTWFYLAYLMNPSFYYRLLEENIYYLGAVLFWISTTFYFKKKQFPTKIARNFGSTLHATIVGIFYLFGLSSEYLFYISFAYYLVDSFPELYYFIKLRRLSNLLMVGHHIISCLALTALSNPLDPRIPLMVETFAQLEISNYPIYLVYHLKTTGYDNDLVIRLLIFVEFVSYFVLRIYFIGLKLYSIIFFGGFSYLMIIGIGIIYGLSCLWLCGMILQLCRRSKSSIG